MYEFLQGLEGLDFASKFKELQCLETTTFCHLEDIVSSDLSFCGDFHRNLHTLETDRKTN